jgi:hypothetical protein
MPTVLRDGPYRLFFYSGDGGEPPHVHVQRDTCEAKYWLDPIRLERNVGYRGRDLNDIERIIADHQRELLDAWHDFFD